MPPNRTAQTSTEVKKAYKKNGSVISDRTHKQLERGYELDQRAAREREAERRRRLAKEKRLERERKEENVRKQLGVGLATQLIGYSHTQANLKKGMEAFLGVNKKKQEEERRKKEEERRREEELAKKLEVIAQDIEKEPFDDDEDMEDVVLDLPVLNAQSGEAWVEDDLDDDTLLEVHDFVISDPVEEPKNESIALPPLPMTALPLSQYQTPDKHQHPPDAPPAQISPPAASKPGVVKEDIEFTRTHGPVNKTVESALEKLPGEIVELLSQDVAAISSGWTPAHGLLYKLNPVGVPPHRLRIKVGCVVVCLRDLNTSSQLSKSQHVRVLRVGNERLECITLDGQLVGTKTVITRVPFPARYRNDEKFPFTRTQYPVRVATDYVSTDVPREAAQSGFKLPSIIGQVRPPALVKRPTTRTSRPKPQASSNPSFKLPGLPASKAQPTMLPEPQAPNKDVAPAFFAIDSWDDFLESGTQIARELSGETSPKASLLSTISRPSAIESVPPLSTQDLDFSLDDLEDEPQVIPVKVHTAKDKEAILPLAKVTAPARPIKSPPSVRPGPLSRTANIRRIEAETDRMPHAPVRPQKPQHLKSKRQMPPPPKPIIPAKKLCTPSSLLAPPPLRATTMTSKHLSDFGMSTQEATSFFDDDDDFTFGSPPIAV